MLFQQAMDWHRNGSQCVYEFPRWGIWNPTYINSLIRSARRNLGSDAQVDDSADSISNVTQLKKKAN